jgi:lipopolysaccharide transport system ATP-binding protein
MSKPIIEVEHLSKCYRIGATRERYLSLRDELAKKTRRVSSAFSRAFRKGQPGPSDNETDFWALNDVSFSVQEGEAVGIIGRNGAGKSTLLKILSQITPPTKGQIIMRGRVASLLEVGTGFHPELTGRENIFLNGAILGMTRVEIRKKFDEIVAFSEVEKFLDTPVKRYSSGMYVRLAFAVAAHLEPEILVVDEVLAVGDAAFQKKCLGKMGNVATEGRTVLFVSHNMGSIQHLCKKSIYLERGSILRAGNTTKVIETYLSSLNKVNNQCLADIKDRKGNGKVRIVKAYFMRTNGDNATDVLSGDNICLMLGYVTDGRIINPVFKMSAYNQFGQMVMHCDSSVTESDFRELQHDGIVGCWFQRFPLAAGNYKLNVSVEANGELLDHISSALSFVVRNGNFYGTGRICNGLKEICLVDYSWRQIYI